MSLVVRPARAAELMPILGLATAFYREGGFSTPVPELQHNLGVLIASPDAHVAVAEVGATQIAGFAITTLSFGLEQGRHRRTRGPLRAASTAARRNRRRTHRRQRRLGAITRVPPA